MKKVLLLANSPLKHDGLTKIELDIMGFCKDKIQFEVACGYIITDEFKNYLETKEIIYYQMPLKRNLISYVKGIKQLVKKNQYDSVYVHGNSSLMVVEAFAAKLGRGKRIITHCHNTKSNHMILHYLVKPVFNMLIDVKIGCSSLASKWAYCGKNIITIANGVEIEKYKYNKNIRDNIRSQLGWTDDITVIGHIGRFNKQKNHERIVTIFEKIREKKPSSRLLLVGEGELKQHVLSLINEKNLKEYVTIVDYTERPQDYLQAMDVMLLPSLFEGFGLVVVEAQANGLPVIISSVCPDEIVASNLVKVLDLGDSSEKWADMAIILSNYGRVDVTQQLQDKGYDYSIMMSKLLNILQE